MLCGGNEVFFDATNPDARTYVWGKIQENYYDQGAKLFWLDVAEPEYSVYDFKNYRYQLRKRTGGSEIFIRNII